MADTALNEKLDSGKDVRRCEWCGVDISHRGVRAFSCGDKCSHHLRKKLKGSFSETRQCEWCGEDYEARASWQRWCGSLCKKRNSSHNLSVNREGVTKDCAVCGNAFRAKASALTCSPSCSRQNTRNLVRRSARVKRRRNAADRALSLLLLPVTFQLEV